VARVAVPVTSIAPPYASLTTALAGTNNDLVFTAVKRGAWGNAVSVIYVDPGGTSATLGVVVEGFKITVNLGRTASAIDTTAAALMAAVIANADAAQLVTIANAAANDGTGLVIALAETFLAGGSLQTAQPTQVNSDATNGHYFTGNDGQTVIEVFNNNAAPKWVRVRFGRGAGMALLSATPYQQETITNATTKVLGPFENATFDQNNARDIYFDAEVVTDLKFRVYRIPRLA
jgi:hypothetical protein